MRLLPDQQFMSVQINGERTMKFVHLSDLHLGKRVNEFPMTEDQRYILNEIIGIIKKENPQAVLIAGDIYDKPVPPAEAVELFDSFISELAEMDLEIFIISGNHDSAERLSFGSRIMDRRGVHFAGGYDGKIHMFSVPDEFGSVNIYMLPFLKPSHVRSVMDREGLPEEERQKIVSYTDAAAYAISRMNVDPCERNVIVSHQFVTGSLRSDSEEISVGGLDNVDDKVYEAFDYTALGHLHIAQNTGSARIRYSGSPLKYSFSEAGHDKTVTIVELGEKKDGVCSCDLNCPVLEPLRDLKVLKGKFADLTDKNYYRDIKTDDYFRIILTDEDDVIGALGVLRSVYPNIMRLEYDNTRSRAVSSLSDVSETDGRSPLEIFGNLYESQNGKAMDEEQIKIVSEMIDHIWSEQK